MYFLLPTFFVLLFGAQVYSLSYPTTKTVGMVGYAKVGGTTGGWSGSVVEVNNLADLKKYAGDNIARVLVINSNIKASTKTFVALGSNKSIIGSFNKPTLYNIYLRDISTSGNIIFQNLIFQHDVNIKDNDDIQIYLRYGKKYWIDHCSFVGHAWSANDGSLDKLLYVGESADYVTLSNCYIGSHKYGVILGYPLDSSKKNYDLRMTVCYNYYENLEVRAPGLMRWGHFHAYNNYVNNYRLGFTVATNAHIYSENNYFESRDKSCNLLDDKGTGQFTDRGSYPPVQKQRSLQCNNWSPKSQYSYTLKTAADAKTFVKANAGAQSSGLKFTN